MTDTPRTILVCSCEDTMPLDLAAIARANPDAAITAARQLCIAEAGLAQRAAGAGALTIACTYQAPLFQELLAEAGRAAPTDFVNIRETAGWSRQAHAAGPKMAALLALAEEPASDLQMISLTSEGVAIVLGRDEAAIETARRLEDALDITVLLRQPGAITPPAQLAFPVFRGAVRSAAGRLGGFDLVVDDFCAPSPSSRGALAFGPAKNGANSRCDIVIDLTGGAPLFPGHDLRPGYLKADPASPAGIEKLIADARDLVGTFDKPRYVEFRADLCAHSRSGVTGCTRCIEVCPAGAITPDGDAVAIDPAICAGCGGCGAVCPTGAASYALPSPDAGLRRLRTLLLTYAAAGGTDPVVLLHDGEHGAALIDALARHGAGLPANVLPLAVNETTQIGVEWLAAALAHGAVALRVLTRDKPRHDQIALDKTLALGRVIFAGLGFAEDAAAVIATDDPDALGAALDAIRPGPAVAFPAQTLPLGGKRQVQRAALRDLHAAAPAPVDRIALPAGAPMGRVVVDVAGCTLCLACVSICPADALSANPDRPALSFAEDACVQCGLCAGACPEKVITLEPRLDFLAIAAPPVVLKEEEPHACERCGKLFGTKATVARIREKLAGKHWMFSGANASRLDVIGLCDDCRVAAATESGLDPYAGPARAPPSTTDDYLRDRKAREDGEA